MKLIGFDTETTGLEWANGHRIIELATVLTINGKTVNSFVKRFNPQRPIDPKATEVHGITFEQVSGCGLFEADAPRISTLMNAVDAIVTHNGIGFDIPFLNHELRMAGAPEVTTPVVDTMVQGRWATAFGKNCNLGELCFACGVPYDTEKAHGALYDVEVMLACFEHAHSKGYFTIPVREQRIAA